ncbi:hypothetical protein LTS10_003664 [Elasticomyces elasticus]|nr:hypothetical protein LTS10_003664 [Elasticomyces elasticus]
MRVTASKHWTIAQIRTRFQTLQANAAAFPSVFYHPRDRCGVVLPHEEKAAAVVRSLGFSLVMVTVTDEDAESWAKLDEGELGPAAEARWSVGADYELFPPLYVGYFMGQRNNWMLM